MQGNIVNQPSHEEVTYGHALLGLLVLVAICGMGIGSLGLRKVPLDRQLNWLCRLSNACSPTVSWSFTLFGLRKLQKRSFQKRTILACFSTLMSLLAMLNDTYPTLRIWGLGRVMGGVAKGTLWFFMENFFILQVPRLLWGRYLGIYLVVYHLISLICHFIFGTGLISQRHTVISSAAFCIFFLIFPDYFLWKIDTSHQMDRPKKVALYSRSAAINRTLTRRYFSQGVIGVVGLLLSTLTAFHPLSRICHQSDRMQRWIQVTYLALCLCLGGLFGQFLLYWHSKKSKHSSVALLRLNLLLFGVGILGLHQMRAYLKLCYLFTFCIGLACHSLYPILIGVLERCALQIGWKPLLKKIDNSFMFANFVCSAESLFSLCCFNNDSLVIYFMHTYTFLVILAFQSELAEQYVKNKCEEVKYWLNGKKQKVQAQCKKVVKV